MAKTSRRTSRILAKERKRADRERAGNRRRLMRRLTVVGAGAAALLLASGLALEWVSGLGSTAVSAFESTARGTRSETGHPVSRLSLDGEEIYDRWARLAERRRRLEMSMSESIRRGRVVSPLAAGSSAVRLPEAMRMRVVPPHEQLEALATEYPALREQVDGVRADMRRRGR